MNKISFAILCNYVQLVATTFCLLLFPSISSYNWYQSQSVIMNSTQLSVTILDGKKLQSVVCADESFV